MMFLSSLSALLAATILAGVRAQGPEETCGTQKYDLVTNGMKLGHFFVTDKIDDKLNIQVNIEGAGMNDSLENSFPYITQIRAKVCCKTVPLTGCSDIMTFTPTGTNLENQVVDFLILEPTCDVGVATDIRVMADFEEPGGIAAFNNIFPASGIDLQFKVVKDAGNNVGASFFDATFHGDNVPDVLKGKTFDGFCVDEDTYISPGHTYYATAYSFLQIDFENGQVPPNSNIHNPRDMDVVSWCLNNFIPGHQYTLYGYTFTLHSTSLQYAIWKILDDRSIVYTPSYVSQLVQRNCEENGHGFVPGCDDIVPVVVVPHYKGDARQNQYVQTTFAKLQVPCNDGVTGDLRAHAYCVTDTMGSSGGDPHFQTFGNDWFDFHGGCDLLLAEYPAFGSGLGLTVDVRTTTRYDYSFIESAAVKIGDDVLEVMSYGQYLLNGIANVEMPLMLGDYPVSHTQPRKHTHIFSIDIGNEKNIVIKVYKDLVYVTLNVHSGHSAEFHDGYGMLGSWFNGTRYARDGVTILMDDNEYGQEWQVRDTDTQVFSIPRAPQWPEKCEMPNVVERASRRLGESTVSAEDAAAACAGIKNMQQKEMCIYDVVATQDLSVAEAGVY